MLTKDILNILTCPACKGKLTARDNKSKLMCHSCGRAFPVREGIPVMLVDDCEKITQSNVIKTNQSSKRSNLI